MRRQAASDVSRIQRPRLHFLAEDAGLKEDLRNVLLESFDLTVVTPEDGGVAGAVFGFASIRERATRRRIEAGRKAVQPAPSLLVTSNHPSNLLWLGEIVVERVHPLEEGLRDLPELFAELISLDPMLMLARDIEARGDLDPIFKRALVLILRSVPPIGSVKRLCRLLGIGRSTLHDHWPGRRTDASAKPADVIRWVALYHAARVLEAGLSSTDAVRTVGWNPRRLEATARSLTGLPLLYLGREVSHLFAAVQKVTEALAPVAETASG